MSANYNTRRSGGYGGQQQQMSNIGQRRPISNNFVPGGQLNSQSRQQQQQQPQQKPIQQQQARQPQQQGGQASGINFRQQPPQQQAQPQSQQQQQYVTTKTPQPQTNTQQQAQAAAQRAAQLQQAQQLLQQQQQLQQQQTQLKQDAAVESKADGEAENADGTPKKKNPFWATRSKISKKEKLRRRNLRLSKILQPKNAVMILNELVQNASYAIEEIQVKVDPNQYKATVTFEDQSHVGLGRSKNAAKNSAAEAALKYLLKHKRLSLDVKKDENGDEQMEVEEETTTAEGGVLPWQHVASFALYKLFSSWGEDPALTTRVNQAQESLGCLKAASSLQKTQEMKPAKKMPANPETVNPLMLVNQMLPQACFEEVSKTGNPPNITFTFNCTVDGQTFSGTGPNKKAAKKQAAFGVCHKVLGINYPAEVYIGY